MDSLAHILHYEFIKPIKGAISGYPTMFSLKNANFLSISIHLG